MDFNQAMSIVQQFVNGQITSSDSNLTLALNILSVHSWSFTLNKWNFNINGQSADRFDTDILGFINYWYALHSGLGFQYNPNYVKAMIGVETKMGTYAGGKGNGLLDVMQDLDGRNPSVYCMAKIAPVNGVGYDPNEGLSLGMITTGYPAVKNIFVGSPKVPSPGLVNPRLSLCFGILWLGYKTAHAGSIDTGVTDYNGGGDPNYLTKVKSIVSNPQNIFTI